MKIQLLTTFGIIFAMCMQSSFASDDEFHGTMEPIPAKIIAEMQGHTWHNECPMPLDKMSYLTLTYLGFDQKPHVGHLIVLKSLAGETLQIFQELYQIKYPIERIELPDTYKTKANDWSSIDWKSAEENNTSGFFCRDDDQNPGQFSPHSYGIAFDINPVYNPSLIANNHIMPKAGKKYFDRKIQHPGMIDERVVAIFTKHGWKWGGVFFKR